MGISFSKLISAAGLISSVAFAIAPQFNAIHPKTAAWLVLIGTVVSAASGALLKFGESNKAMTTIGVVVAVASVAAGANDLIPTNITMILSVIGTAAAAVGKSLFGFDSSEEPPRWGGSLLVIFALGGTLLLTGCDKAKEFAKATDRVAGYVGVGHAIVARQTATGEMTAATGLVIVDVLTQINTLNGALIVEAKKYQTADGNLALTGEGKAKLLAIVGSSKTIVQSLVNNPAISDLSPTKRQEITLLATNLTDTITALATLIEAVKVGGGK